MTSRNSPSNTPVSSSRIVTGECSRKCCRLLATKSLSLAMQRSRQCATTLKRTCSLSSKTPQRKNSCCEQWCSEIVSMVHISPRDSTWRQAWFRRRWPVRGFAMLTTLSFSQMETHMTKMRSCHVFEDCWPWTRGANCTPSPSPMRFLESARFFLPTWPRKARGMIQKIKARRAPLRMSALSIRSSAKSPRASRVDREYTTAVKQTRSLRPELVNTLQLDCFTVGSAH
mmetsp:Transcript_5413/g.12836  ORF Transcript_5413/g.12836 Transcript_5413/m.12836 type:complete len:228 (+) Transcript_5413:2689-3372(+)